MLDLIVQEIEKKGYCHMTDVLSRSELGEINSFFDQNKSDFKPAMVGPVEKKLRLESVRGDYTFWIDPLNPSMIFSKIISFLQNLKETLNSQFFLGLKEFECHLAYYPPGTFYKKHSDLFEKSSTRKLSFIFYLHQEWESHCGGELIIYNQDNSILESINPLPGSFACFLSEEFPHEVKKGNFERRSLTGWMHTKILY